MKTGDVISWQRTFTEEDIRLFTRLSGDAGEHHLQPDEQGRVMAHGLLTATLPTKIGGDLNFIAQEMTFQFRRPVFAGATIDCDVTLKEFEPGDKFFRVVAHSICRNQHGKEVMSGEARGVIRNPRADGSEPPA